MSEAHSDSFDLKDLYDEDIDPDPESRADRTKRFLEMNIVAPARIAVDDWRALVGGAILAFFLLMGTVGVWLVERPTSGDAPVLAAPFESLAYPLGTDVFGQPIHAQLIHATPGMFKMIFAGAVVSVGFAALVGVVAGFEHGTRIDSFLMTVTDVVITIPGLPLIIVITAIFQPENPYIVGVFLGIDNWPGLARTVRSQVLSIREESYVEASEIMGIPLSSILRRDILSQLMPYVMINGALTSRRIIFESVGLYFLGILPFTTFNWGVMMNLAYEGNALTRPDMLPWMVAPMVCIFLLSFGLVLLSQGLDSLFNVRLRARHAKTSKKKGTSKNNQSQATGGD
ncbi:ABC transporter permease [Haloferax sulfurifontis]|uniref:Peptide ABC transporter permease n=2 Tax=Haloferax sulfurifontis TaxID=255616 RepID=M0ILI6_9EURY|nr:ABC transporter permease [Haloferax sulfurifontis]ELZ96329.1 peptide ABC transporter permease [Haloferax sulfurifontis ATCC BAA-897]GGC64899.1 peptide ABC transporter permease [Haloferax sulfurifontis]